MRQGKATKNLPERNSCKFSPYSTVREFLSGMDLIHLALLRMTSCPCIRPGKSHAKSSKE